MTCIRERDPGLTFARRVLFEDMQLHGVESLKMNLVDNPLSA